MKTRFFRLYLMPLLVSCCFLSYANTSSPSMEDLRKSQVHIVVHHHESERMYEGVGFFISDRVFVTTSFLALYIAQRGSRSIITQDISPQGKSSPYTFSRVKNISLLHDLAVVEVEEKSSHVLKISKASMPKSVYLLPIDSRNNSKIKSLHLDTNKYTLEFTAPYISTASFLGGSPVFDSSGKAAGVFQFKSGENYFIALKGSILNEFLSTEFSQEAETAAPTNIDKIIIDELLNLLKKSIAGDALAQYKLSSYLFDPVVSKYISNTTELGEYQHVNWLRQSAENGNPHAAFDLSQKLQPINPLVSFQFAKIAAEKGFVPAFHTLATRYLENGNKAKALYWEKKAAERQYIPAQLGMNNYFTASHPPGHRWIEEAAKINSPIATHLLALEALNQSQNTSSNNEKRKLNNRGVNLLTKSSNQDHPASQFLLGTLYSQGEHGLRVDKQKALLLVTRAANQGYHYAQIYLSHLRFPQEGQSSQCQNALRSIHP